MAITAPIIEGDEPAGRVDLSAIDFEKLAKLFASRPKTAAEKLRSEAAKRRRTRWPHATRRASTWSRSWRSSSRPTISARSTWRRSSRR